MDIQIDQLNTYKFKIISIATLLTTGLIIYKRKFKSSPKIVCLKNEKLDGKIIIVTGANTGIGYETSLELANRRAFVILACRDLDKAFKVQKLIKTKTKNNNIVVESLDLSSLDSVKDFSQRICQKYDKIDILINNAGVMGCPKWTTKDGYEYQFQVNYLSHYLLTRLLLDKILKSQEGRIINLTSKLYETASVDWNDINLSQNYNPTKAYKQSKLFNILFTNELQNYFEEKSIKNIQVCSVSPGIVLTNLGRYFFLNKPWFYKLLAFVFYPIVWFLLKTPKQGAECTVYCAIKPNLEPKREFYFRNCEQIALLPNALNKSDSEKLWKMSEKLVSKWL